MTPEERLLITARALVDEANRAKHKVYHSGLLPHESVVGTSYVEDLRKAVEECEIGPVIKLSDYGPGMPAMITIDGHRYSCTDCGCRVFTKRTHRSTRQDIYICNACNALYEEFDHD